MRVRGFTLIEVICTVSIILILLSIAIPVSLSQIAKVTDRKFVIEGKLIENAVNIHNFETPNNIIKERDTISTVKIRLIGSTKKYLTSWPQKLRVVKNSSIIEVDNESLSSYTLNELKEYVRKQEDGL